MMHLLLPILLAAPPVIEWAPQVSWCEAPPEVEHIIPDHIGVLLEETPTETESRQVDEILDTCPNAQRGKTDPFVILATIRFEKTLVSPTPLLLVATFCIESGFATRPEVYGDHGNALGAVQLHEPLSAWCIDGDIARTPKQWHEASTWQGRDWRNDWLFSVYCYQAHIERLHLRAEKKCRAEAARRVAESMVASPARNWRCSAQSSHWTLMERWHEHKED